MTETNFNVDQVSYYRISNYTITFLKVVMDLLYYEIVFFITFYPYHVQTIQKILAA